MPHFTCRYAARKHYAKQQTEYHTQHPRAPPPASQYGPKNRDIFERGNGQRIYNPKPKFKFSVEPINHNDFINPIDEYDPTVPGRQFTMNDVLSAGRYEKRGRDMRDKRVALFNQWISYRRADGLYAPT